MHLWHSFILHLTPMDMLLPSLPQVQRFDKYSRNTALGEVRVTLSELKASQCLVLCEKLQKTVWAHRARPCDRAITTQWPESCMSMLMTCRKVDVWPWWLQRLSAQHMPICVSQDTVGEVLVSLKCLLISQRIEVGLLKAKTTSPRSTADKSKGFISAIVADPVFILLPATFILPTQRDGEVLERKVPCMPIATQQALLNQTTSLSSLVTVCDRGHSMERRQATAPYPEKAEVEPPFSLVTQHLMHNTTALQILGPRLMCFSPLHHPASWRNGGRGRSGHFPSVVLSMETTRRCIRLYIDVSCRCHRKKHQKSRPWAHTLLIIFNETFLFHMPEPPAWDCTVLVSIYEVDSDPRHLIGQATLGKRRVSEGADHCDLMIKSIQQPVAKWHPLLI
ncbi:uncharacterized protein J5F26_004985 [Ciconia maguari]